ncbi:porin [Trinickia sp. Y13]|uniref:porin n=1 Tax=Trinickia sp. Y13 TaxID=2917807 RepID=UPI002405EAB9|nr:porin [Trinickia sp. Y13]MDG0027317.1 porin [Trinickia sp. Y13]
MKKTLITLAALSTFAGIAKAQSTVTLYGIADAGVLYTSNVNTPKGGKSLWQLASGNASGSRWGFKGSEDLGGGLKAIFQLENGFGINNGTFGQGGRLFGRQAFVGLSSAEFGALTMGRQYNAMQDFVEPFAAAGWSLAQLATHPFDNDNLDNTFRTDNSIKFSSRVISGFQAEAMYAFSNSTNFANNRSYSVGATYVNGPLKFGAGYARMQSPGAIGGAVVGNPSSSGVSDPLISGSRVDQWGAAGSYVYGPATVRLLYTGSLYTDSSTPLTATRGSIHFHNFDGSVSYRLTPTVVLALAESYTGVSQAGDSGHYLQTSAGADYLLSKRTDLYANVFYQKTSGNLHASINAAGGTASGSAQTAVVIGMRHRF